MPEVAQPITIKTYESPEKSTWCPGCGDFPILSAIKQALLMLKIAPHEVIFTSGIGCGSKLPHYIRANGYNAIHGRALPVATGLKLANQKLHVISVTGDGDGYGIGGNHFIHIMRRNPNITHIVQNNQVYGLTKGQYSPTSDKGYITTTSPEGAIEYAINPIALALATGATFISRAFAGDLKGMAQIMARAIQHKGYALVDVLQPCVTFNKVNTYEWYKARIYDAEKEAGYLNKDRAQAWHKAQEWGTRIPIGVIYQEEGRPTYEDEVPALKKGPLVDQPIVSPTVREDWEKLKASFM